MTTMYQSLKTHFDVESMLEYTEVSCRFLQGFDQFAAYKKYQAVQTVLPEEIQNEMLVRSLEFQHAIARRVDDEALLEKRFIFLSVNPQAQV